MARTVRVAGSQLVDFRQGKHQGKSAEAKQGVLMTEAERELMKAAEELDPSLLKVESDLPGIPPQEVLGRMVSKLGSDGALDNMRALLTFLTNPKVFMKLDVKIQILAMRIMEKMVEVAAGQTVRLGVVSDTTTLEEQNELEQQLLARYTSAKMPAGINPPRMQ